MINNRKRELKAENLLSNRSGSLSTISVPSTSKSGFTQTNVDNVDGELICEKLKNDSSNWDNVKSLWKSSYMFRRQIVLNASVKDVIEKWPSFKFPLGYTLVCSFKTNLLFNNLYLILLMRFLKISFHHYFTMEFSQSK